MASVKTSPTLDSKRVSSIANALRQRAAGFWLRTFFKFLISIPLSFIAPALLACIIYAVIIRIDPKNGSAHGKRAYIHLKRGNYDQALADLGEQIRSASKPRSESSRWIASAIARVSCGSNRTAASPTISGKLVTLLHSTGRSQAMASIILRGRLS